MLNKKQLFGCSGIAAITGCVIGATIIIKNHIECKKEQQEIMDIMKDINDKSKQVDEFLKNYNIK